MNKSAIHKKIIFAAASLAADGITPLPDKRIALRNLSKWYKNQDRRGRYRIRKTFAKLRGAGLINPSAEETEKNITLTETGRKKVLFYQLDALKLKKARKWDGGWRIAIFNIPENLRSARNFFQRKLKDFGFSAMQKGVWVYPHRCRNEINFLVESLKIQQYVRLIETNQLDDGELFKEKFKL